MLNEVVVEILGPSANRAVLCQRKEVKQLAELVSDGDGHLLTPLPFPGSFLCYNRSSGTPSVLIEFFQT